MVAEKCILFFLLSNINYLNMKEIQSKGPKLIKTHVLISKTSCFDCSMFSKRISLISVHNTKGMWCFSAVNSKGYSEYHCKLRKKHHKRLN